MAMKMGRDKIDEYAKKFGLGSTIGMVTDERSQFYGEDAGSVFLKEGSSDRFLANTAIGQEDVRITPLQAAHLMAMIASDGKAGTPRLVKSLHTEDGLLFKEFKTNEKSQVLGADAANVLKQWARGTIAEPKGTASLMASAKMPVAGKTGTAQTGDPNLNHQWFAGFAPYDDPKYVVVVMAESVSEGRVTEKVALQIFNALSKD
jgi:cell division protein FtsI/penicillin-binding protein 2